jgi:hypothetical protein
VSEEVCCSSPTFSLLVWSFWSALMILRPGDVAVTYRRFSVTTHCGDGSKLRADYPRRMTSQCPANHGKLRG